MEVYNDINDLIIQYDEDGVRSSTRKEIDLEADSSDGYDPAAATATIERAATPYTFPS